MKKIGAWVLFVLLLCIGPAAQADFFETGEAGFYTIYCQGEMLTRISGSVFEGDEYIAGNNQLYRVVSTDPQNRTAQAEYAGSEAFSLHENPAIQVSAQKKERLVALYCTHSDESYIEGDGKSSDEEFGGIYDVSTELKKQFESMGVRVAIDYTTHFPHDAGAYTRSRATAVSLLKQMPDAIFDIHRDGIPADEYITEVDGETITMIRLFVGKNNQNSAANRAFAKKIKAVADEMYPGLIKDIYIGKGNYNQELAPNSILLEFGTHESDKEHVLASTQYMAKVLTHTVFGNLDEALENPANEEQVDEQSLRTEENKGAGRGIAWVLGIAVGGGLLFLLLTKGGRDFASNIGRSVSEMTGGLLGKKTKK